MAKFGPGSYPALEEAADIFASVGAPVPAPSPQERLRPWENLRSLDIPFLPRRGQYFLMSAADYAATLPTRPLSEDERAMQDAVVPHAQAWLARQSALEQAPPCPAEVSGLLGGVLASREAMAGMPASLPGHGGAGAPGAHRATRQGIWRRLLSLLIRPTPSNVQRRPSS